MTSLSPRSTAPQQTETVCRTGLPANQLAAAGARRFVRTLLTERAAAPDAPGAAAISRELIDQSVLLVSELVTNAVMYAGTDIDVTCRLEYGRKDAPAPAGGPRPRAPAPGPPPGPATVAVVLEVSDRHPSRVVRGGVDARSGEPGYGLQLVSALAESWGVTYRKATKTVWFRLTATEGEPETTPAGPARPPYGEATPVRGPAGQGPACADAAEWADRGGPSFLAETSELLAGQLDQDMVTALAAQLLVPRLADWCAIWLCVDGGRMQLSRVWHVDERRIGPLRTDLEREPPTGIARTGGTAWPWPECAGACPSGGSALAFPLVARDELQGVLLLGRAGRLKMTDTVIRMVEDVARRVAQAVHTARQYTRQTSISLALQRRQLPASLASIPGVDTAVVYEPHGAGQTVGGDFYDIFPMGDRRWCFLLGDVQGKDPEAMSVTGLARHLVRLLAREGHGVESVLGRLNLAMAEESAEAVEVDGEQAGSRFLSLLYGELAVDPGVPGARCTVASAGHPPPLHLFTDGTVEPASDPQMLLGIDEGTEFHASTFTLAPGETLLCVTDGVTERRCGTWQLDDNDGLAEVLRDGLGLGAKALAEHVRRAAHDFGTGPVEDDLSVLVLQPVSCAPGPDRTR
ncbi:SpoIIE family protein phosphatase [Streptomyces sp. RS10V-4]|uniref:SpoIIE family protein phosphatase n=1 Tax=Streptomyces rhizoryzae TaxID=2932493 RepID=UPI002003F434|nr:SpoIIE family protein phosphatase [Streptomyces rhizoryzae]MCK7627525.1 SpoIIE family protein phosphatase [Streptomyces rhizoryzae]